MEIWQAILTAAGTCFVTLLVTYFFNLWTTRPKKKKEEKAAEEAKRKQALNEVKEELLEKIEDVKQERIAEREACGKDHISLVRLVRSIQSTNKAQNTGLQAVLKDLLKIRYLEWIKKGCAPMDAKDDLEKMYQAYHGLGANGVMDNLREQFLSLPTSTSMEDKEE